MSLTDSSSKKILFFLIVACMSIVGDFRRVHRGFGEGSVPSPVSPCISRERIVSCEYTERLGAGVETIAGSGFEPVFLEKIPVNSATTETLQTIPGIGKTLAKRIIQARLERGGFESLEELGMVRGVGREKLKTIALYVSFQTIDD